jgi:hypothetical protein
MLHWCKDPEAFIRENYAELIAMSSWILRRNGISPTYEEVHHSLHVWYQRRCAVLLSGYQQHRGTFITYLRCSLNCSLPYYARIYRRACSDTPLLEPRSWGKSEASDAVPVVDPTYEAVETRIDVDRYKIWTRSNDPRICLKEAISAELEKGSTMMSAAVTVGKTRQYCYALMQDYAMKYHQWCKNM